MAPSAFVTLCLLALASSAASQTSPENVAKIDALMPEICTLSQGQSDLQVASLVSEGIDLLRFTPDDAVVGILDKIRAGQYCADSRKLESLFLDAVAFVGTPGAFKVMEQELASGSTTGGRLILYTVAMTPLSPIFEEYMNIATNKGTEIIQLVQDIIKDKNINIDTIIKELKKLILLVQNTIKDKNINIDTVVMELNKFVQLIKDTIKDKNINTKTIVVELQKFIKMVQDTLKNKNINIDSMVTEFNKLTQVIQDTLKKNGIDIDMIVIKLKELFQLVLNTIKEKDININAIAVDLQKLLRLVKNTMKDKDINMYTIVKQINKIMQFVLNTIKDKDINIDNIVVELKKFMQLVQVTLKDNGINIDTLVRELTKLIQPVLDIIKENNINIDAIKKTIIRLVKKYFNINIPSLLKSIDQNVMKMVDTITPVISDVILGAQDINIDTARTGQINLDLLIPFITGFPLKIKLTGTAVVGIKAINNLNVKKGALDALLKIIPSLNTHVEAQFGFGEQLSTGIKLKNSVFTTNGFSLSLSTKNGKDLELQYELPEKMELFGIESTVSLMKSDKVVNEVQFLPGKMQYIRIASNQCTGIVEPITGLMLCYDINTPDLISSNTLPLGIPMFLRVYLQKSDSTMNGYRLAAKLINKPAKKLLKFDVGTYGAATSKMSTLELSYTKGDDTHFIALDVQSTPIKSFSEITFIVRPEYKSLQIYGNNKILNFAPVEGKLKIDFDSLNENNGKTYQIETYLGLSKSLNQKNRLFKIALSILENGDMNTAYFVTRVDLLPIIFEVEFDLPKNAGLLIHKVEKITVRYSVADVEVEGRFMKYSPEEFQTSLLLLNAGSALININAVNTLSFDSPLIGGAANKVNLLTTINGQIINTEFGLKSGLTYEKGELALVSSVSYFDSEVLKVFSGVTLENGAVIFENGIDYFGSQLLEHSCKLAFENGEIGIDSGIRYLRAEAIKVKSQFSYATEALELTSGIKYYDSEILVNSQLSYANGVVELNNEASYLGTIVFASTIQQSLDMKNIAFKAEINMPIVKFGIQSKLSYSNLMITSSNIVSYSGSEVVNANSKLEYVRGNIVSTSKITSELFSRELFYAKIEQTVENFPIEFKTEVAIPTVISVHLRQSIDSAELTSAVQVTFPAVMKPLYIQNVIGINSAFSYSLATDVISNRDETVLHIEGPLSFDLSKELVQQNLQLTISGAFDGTFKIKHGITLSLEKIEYIVDIKHTSTPIAFINLVLDRSNFKEISSKSIVNLPFVIESEITATITMSLIHATMNILALPSTPYSRRFKGSTDINWIENIVKADLYWDAENDTDKKIELTTKYALDITALKLIIQSDLVVKTLNFGCKLETTVASPREWFQGASGTELIFTMPSKKIAVAKSIIDIQYTESEFLLKPVIAFITTNENKYELATSVVMKTLPSFLNFAITSETMLSTPQLQQITLVTSLMHEKNEYECIFSFKNTLKESVLSEELSSEYVLTVEPTGRLIIIMSVMKGANTASLSTLFNLMSEELQITNRLSLPQVELMTMITLKAKGKIMLALYKNNSSIIMVFYSMPVLTSHTVGFVMPHREIDFSIEFAWNQITLKIFPAANNSPRALELTLRLNTGAGRGQLEALVTAPSLSKEIRLAVELELIEAGKDKFDMVSIDVQYQVSETPKLLKVALKELKKIYLDLVQDSLSPDFNKWFRKAQKVLKQAPKYLNSLKDQITMSIPQYFELVKNYVNDIYQLYEADVTAMWNLARKELLGYLNKVKTEAPVLFNKYFTILKKTEIWNAIQVTLGEVIVNYPVYYDAAIDFYNKVIIPYVAQLTEMVGEVLVLPEFDVIQFMAIVKQEVSTIVEKVGPQILNTKLVKMTKGKFFELKTLSQEKLNELKTLYPMEFSLLDDVYTNVILPTSSEVFAIISKMLAVPDFDYVKYFDIIITDVPVLLNTLSQRILNTQVVNKLRAAFPVIFIIIEDIYSNVFLPTINDIVALFQKVVALPIDFEEYLAISKFEVPVIVSRVMQRICDTQLLKELKASFPTMFEVSEDFYTKVIIPSIEDFFDVVGNLIALPIVDLQETVTTYWAFLKSEVPPRLTKVIQRIPETKLVRMLKTLYPMIFKLTDDVYTVVIVPTATNIVSILDKLINIPISDIQVAVKRSWNILKVEIPTLMKRILRRVPKTQIYLMTKEKSTELLQLLQEKLDEVKAQYPDAVAMILDFYNQVAVPAYSDLAIIYEKLVKVSDVYQLRDVLGTEVVVLLKNLQMNLSNTTIMKIAFSKFSELLSKLSELLVQLHELLAPLPEYQNLLENYDKFMQAALKLYNQIIQITPDDFITPLKSYFIDDLGFSLMVSAEKLTATFPLLVSVEDIRYNYHVFFVSLPAYALEQLTEFGAQWLPQGRLLYKYIEDNTVLIVDYINTQTPIYLQYIKDYLETLQVIIPQYVEQFKADFPKYIDQLQTFLLPYFDQIKTTAVTYFEFARDSSYGKLLQKKIQESIELLMTKLDELLNLYPKEYQAIKDFFSLCMNICLDYATWAMNTVFEYPPVKEAIAYMATLTLEKLQAILEMFKDFVASTMSQILRS